MTGADAPARRYRDLAASHWVLPTGALNSLGDVPGVTVGHRTIRREGVNTGVTAVIPQPSNLFLDKLTAAVTKLTVGNGLDPASVLGPLIDAQAVAKVEAHVADALAHGAELRLGGRRHPLGGNFYAPTVLTGATPAMQITREETFGPVAAIYPFADEADAITQANASEFGLASYFYARDLSRVWRVAEALEYGMVGVNTGLISTAVAPFGGVKLSGVGREGSRHGVEEYVELKYVCLGL